MDMSTKDLNMESKDTANNDSANKCRICFDCGGNLLSPCECRGSLGHVHFECLCNWIHSSGKTDCTICKSDYYGIKLNKVQQSLKDFLTQHKVLVICVTIYSFFLGNHMLFAYNQLISDTMSGGFLTIALTLTFCTEMICHAVYVQFVVLKTWNERKSRIEVTLDKDVEQVDGDHQPEISSDDSGHDDERGSHDDEQGSQDGSDGITPTTSSGEYIDHDYWAQDNHSSSGYDSD